MKRSAKFVFLFIRISVGWLFLFEGLTKIFDPAWSAEAYLRGSYGFFSPLFRLLASNPAALNVVDFLNEWGLTLIGAGLLLGLFTRVASVSRFLLQALSHPGMVSGMPLKTEPILSVSECLISRLSKM